MILLADSGSTKTDWCLMNSGNVIRQFQTRGLNPYFLSGQQIINILQKEVLSDLAKEEIGTVFFYGAGCRSDDNKSRMCQSLEFRFPRADIHIETDMLGACRAVLSNEPGIMSILGTGSNSCQYDGKKIISNGFSLGYILGDEASGAWFGKELIRLYLRNDLSDEMRKRFTLHYKYSSNELLNQVYKKPDPNIFLASFMPFIIENRKMESIQEIIQTGLELFAKDLSIQYDIARQGIIGFCGSTAYFLIDEVFNVFSGTGVKHVKIVKSPMEGLISYHSQ